MTEIILGKLDSVDAFYDGFSVYLVGYGVNPTSGWLNTFEVVHDSESDWNFMQEPPSGIVSQVMTPFIVLQNVIFEDVPENLKVRIADSGGAPEVISVPIRSILTPSDQCLIREVNPVQTYFADDPRVNQEESEKAAIDAMNRDLARMSYLSTQVSITDMSALKRVVFTRTLASFDQPIDCCDFSRWPPCRGNRTSVVLTITVEEEQEIRKGVEECLRESALVAALAAIAAAVATGGVVLNAAITAFLLVFKPCMLKKLTNVIDIDIKPSTRCND